MTQRENWVYYIKEAYPGSKIFSLYVKDSSGFRQSSCCQITRIGETNAYYFHYHSSHNIVNHSEDGLLEQCIDILTHKLSPWKYEQEVRYLRVTDSDNTNPYLSISITKVYLGSKLSPKSVNHYKQLISLYLPNVNIQQVRLDELTWWNGEVNSILLR